MQDRHANFLMIDNNPMTDSRFYAGDGKMVWNIGIGAVPYRTYYRTVPYYDYVALYRYRARVCTLYAVTAPISLSRAF